MENLQLEKIANEVRKDVIKGVHSAKSGHPGGSLSVADMLTFLYFEEMNVDPKNPKMEDRDRLVLSKGHVSPIYYSVLANLGFFPKKELKSFRDSFKSKFLKSFPSKPQFAKEQNSLPKNLNQEFKI